MKEKKEKLQRGSGLMEAVIALGVFTIIATIFAQTFTMATMHITDVRARLVAVSVASQQMEQLRNLDYDAVAVVGGVPSGDIDPDKIVSVGNRSFHVMTDIHYVDDINDGTIDTVPIDVIPNDYKVVNVDVSWGNAVDMRHVRLMSQFVPPGIESYAGGGTLVLNVLDAEGQGVPGASVSIVNSDVSPPISLTTLSNAMGSIVVPGAPESDSYSINILKSGYESVVTYPPYPETVFYPNDRHSSVISNALTAQSFISGILSDVTLRIVDVFGDSISGESVDIIGGRILGSNTVGSSVFNFDSTEISDSNGHIVLSNREPGSYSINIQNNSWRLLLVDDDITAKNDSFSLSQGVVSEIDIVMANIDLPSLLVHVTDNDTGDIISGVTVRVYHSTNGYDRSLETNIYGDIYFSDNQVDMLIDGASYTIETSYDGYDDHIQSIVIDKLTDSAVLLIPE